jgi:hypothetical protein
MASHPERPFIELADPEERRMIRRAKRHGVITRRELDRAIHPERLTPGQVDDVDRQLAQAGIRIIEAEED